MEDCMASYLSAADSPDFVALLQDKVILGTLKALQALQYAVVRFGHCQDQGMASECS